MAVKEKDIEEALLEEIEKSEDSIGYSRVTQNVSPKIPFHYGASPDIDVLEAKPEEELFIGYEIKGDRKRNGDYEPQPWYKGLDQALAYLMLPVIVEESCQQIEIDPNERSGILDYVYLIHPVEETHIGKKVERIFENVPVGLMFAERRKGKVKGFHTIVDAERNPVQSKPAKDLFLEHPEVLASYRKTY